MDQVTVVIISVLTLTLNGWIYRRATRCGLLGGGIYWRATRCGFTGAQSFYAFPSNGVVVPFKENIRNLIINFTSINTHPDFKFCEILVSR